MGEAKRRKQERAARRAAELSYEMTPEDIEAMAWLVRCAAKFWDGHFTVMKFTTNWRVGFGTPASGDNLELRADIAGMAEGKTLAEAVSAALADPGDVSPMDYEVGEDGRYLRDRERRPGPRKRISEVDQISRCGVEAHGPAGRIADGLAG